MASLCTCKTPDPAIIKYGKVTCTACGGLVKNIILKCHACGSQFGAFLTLRISLLRCVKCLRSGLLERVVDEQTTV